MYQSRGTPTITDGLLAVIEVLMNAPTPLSVAALAVATGRSTGTVRRALLDMEQLGWSARRRYRRPSRGGSAPDGWSLTDAARPFARSVFGPFTPAASTQPAQSEQPEPIPVHEPRSTSPAHDRNRNLAPSAGGRR